jgi:hypothetical protein
MFCKEDDPDALTAIGQKIAFLTLIGSHLRYILTINVPVVYMGRYEVVLRGDYP